MIQQLLTLSHSIAYDISAIQGAGGNTSVKTEDTMWVKASGTLLSDMTESYGWAKVNLLQWREDFSQLTSVNEDKFIKINKDNTIDGARASIETGLHILLPHKFVLHTHSTYANVFLCGKQTDQLIRYINNNEDVSIVVISMCAPGLQLTTFLQQQLIYVDISKPIVILLENHGIAISCNDLDETIRLHKVLHDEVKTVFKLPEFDAPMLEKSNLSFIPFNIITKLVENLTSTIKYLWPFPPKIVSKFNTIPLVFFPDQIVYVNNKLKTKNIIIKKNKIFFNNMSDTQVKNTAEILASVLYLYQNIATPTTLSVELCEYIANMSGEKYRQNME